MKTRETTGSYWMTLRKGGIHLSEGGIHLSEGGSSRSHFVESSICWKLGPFVRQTAK
jgi:hypothetical protein